MRSTSIFFFFATLLLSQQALSAACPTSNTGTGTGAIDGSNCTVTGTASTIQLNFITGFSSGDGLAAIGGNNGTTLGAQRKLSFIKAAEILADQVSSSQTILMDASFSGLSCDTNSATLGSAGATVNLYHPSAPAGLVNNTWYPVGLYNDISNSDQLSPSTDTSGGYSGNGTGSDIVSNFNSNIGQTGCLQGSNGWYYGFEAPPSNYIGFTTVLLHEATHGLGFASLTSASTGAKLSGLDDIFSNKLYSLADTATWANVDGLANGLRAASATSTTGLLWNGSNVNTQAVGLLTAGYHDADVSSSFTAGDRVQMYAPNPVEGGSSVSHFNTAASPNEIMEPQYTAGQLDLGLALYLLKDIGWTVTSAVANNAPTITAIDQSTSEDVAKVVDASGWGGDIDGDTLTYSISSSCATNITCSINSNGTSLTMTPAANHNGGTHTITVSVSDGNGGSVNDTFNLNVIAQNDAPVVTGLPNQSVNVGEFKDIVLSGYASDIESDSLTFSAAACGANLACTFPNTTTIRVAASGGAGSTVTVTVEADDGNSGTNTDTFDVSITAAPVVNSAPAIIAVDQSTNEDIAKVVDASGWGGDIDGDTLTYSISSSCATNITCSINSNGTSLTMVPASNHNGGTHTITINLSDGNGGSTSDTFNLNVIAKNDAPALTGIPNQAVKVGEFKDIVLSGYASDIESDSLAFSAIACGANLTCTFLNATTVRVAASGGAGSIVSVTVEVNDSNGGTNTDTFNVSIMSSVPSTTIETGGSAHNDGDTFILSDSSTQINVNNGTGDYSYSLDYSSTDVSSLISVNATGLTIGLPVSGEFAGDYTLTITDNGDGDIITITVTRPLRLSWSTKAFLNGDTAQTLIIEGGAASTVYSLVQSGSADLIFRDESEASITTVTAENDSDSYNAALIHLDSLTVADISIMEVTVQSSYDDVVESDVKVYPSTLHHFTVKNSLAEPLGSAVATLNGGEALLAELSVLTNYSADVNGTFSVLLPDTTPLVAGSSYAMNVSLAGYNSENLILNSENTVHNVVLTELINGITLNGEINALGGQNLLQQPSVVTLTYGDETTEVITVLVASATQANFSHEIDLNLKSLSSLSISQAASVTIELNLSNISQSQNLDILLLNNVSIVATKPVDTDEGSSGGGSLMWFNLFLLAGLLFRFLLLKKRRLGVAKL